MQALFYVFPREILLQLLHVEIAAGLELRARAEDADNAFVQRPADLRAAGGKLLRQGIEHLVAQAAAVGLRHALEQPGIGHSALQARREQRLGVTDGADDIGLLRLRGGGRENAAVRPIAPRERAQSGSR